MNIEYSNDMQDFYKNTDEYYQGKKCKILINLDDWMADMINNKKLNLIITKLFLRVRQLNILIGFNTQSYFKVPKDNKLNSKHFFLMKIPNKGELHQISLNHYQILTLKIS